MMSIIKKLFGGNAGKPNTIKKQTESVEELIDSSSSADTYILAHKKVSEEHSLLRTAHTRYKNNANTPESKKICGADIQKHEKQFITYVSEYKTSAMNYVSILKQQYEQKLGITQEEFESLYGIIKTENVDEETIRELNLANTKANTSISTLNTIIDKLEKQKITDEKQIHSLESKLNENGNIVKLSEIIPLYVESAKHIMELEYSRNLRILNQKFIDEMVLYHNKEIKKKDDEIQAQMASV